MGKAKLCCAVVFGGKSVEHEISILTAMQIISSIDRTKYDVIAVMQTKDCEFVISEDFNSLQSFRQQAHKTKRVLFYAKGNKVYLKRIFGPKSIEIDVVLLSVHGKGVEDGNLYGYFKSLGCPVTSCDCLVASVFQNKLITKKLLASENISVLPYYLVTEDEWKKNKKDIVSDLNVLDYPQIVKAINQGSSIGIYHASNPDEAVGAIIKALRYDTEVILEKCLVNYREFNQAILASPLTLSLIEEVKTNNSFLTFEDKYQSNSLKRIINPELDEVLANKISQITKKIHLKFNTKSVVRIDYMYDCDKEQLYVNEVNTIPGSLAFYLFEDLGIEFSELIDYILTAAIKNHYDEEQKISTFVSNVLKTSSINHK